MVLKGLLLLLAFVAALPAAERSLKEVSALLDQGKNLSQAEAEKLELRVEQKPKEEEARLRLLGYYASSPAGLDVAVVKRKRLKHILWIIENDPARGLGSFPSAASRVTCEDGSLADPEGFELVKGEWLAQVKSHRSDQAIRRNAVSMLRYCAPEDAEALLIAAGDREGLGSLYATAVLGMTDGGSTSTTRRESPLAQRALKELQEATDRNFVLAAFPELISSGGRLWAEGKLDWDYTPLGKNLWARAQQLDPDNFFLLTLSPQLPARGEQLVRTLLIDSKIQAQSLIRKVTPRYPNLAVAQRIQGTVTLGALIDLDGKIKKLRVQSGPSELIPASVEGVRQYEYKPSLLNGKPCYVITSIDVVYALRQ